MPDELSIERLPIPDPTKLTNEAVAKAVSDLKELFGSKFEALSREVEGHSNVLTQRLIGMDKALELLQKIADRGPQEIKNAVLTLQALHDEKFINIEALMNEQFKGVQTQFRERDTRTEQSSKDSKVAVDAALQAAKEAVGEQTKSQALAIAKSEASTDKRLDQIVSIMNATTNGLNDKIDDLKMRLTIVEGRWQGIAPPSLSPQALATQPSIMPWVMGGFGLFLLVIIVIFEVMQRGLIVK